MHHTVAQGLSKYLLADNYELLSPKDAASVSAIGYGIISLLENTTVKKEHQLHHGYLGKTLRCALRKGPGVTLDQSAMHPNHYKEKQ